MKKIVITVSTLLIFACLLILNNQQSLFPDTTDAGDESNLLPVYKFAVEDIPDYKMDISNLNLVVPRQEISTKGEALEYGKVLFEKLVEQSLLSGELQPIALIQDETTNAWGVSFGTGGVGDGYSIAFYDDGQIIAMWAEE
jgi:hypothetical protein